ncbi:unnamed protein product [marine sediment metagenome]|uniref:ABM domain-containing protein n=1 Tax=marine sediment metagenome TaxID=412755 RepID=X1AXI4_9ZZZZ
MTCAPEDIPQFLENMKQFRTDTEGVEDIGLFYPRGSNYRLASVTKYKDYATWEKHWAKIQEQRQKGLDIITQQTDMFFEEIEL